MRLVLFGSTGMVGQGALRECLLASDVSSVLAVVRAPTGQHHPKLRELVHADFGDFSALEREFVGLDACLYCLGVSTAGTSAADYTRITHDYAIAAASALLRAAPRSTFVFVSGEGADPTERSRLLWTRVKGRTEKDLRALPFARVVVLRPAAIQPLHGIRSRTRSYRILYALANPFMPALRRAFPGHVTTTELLGRALIQSARSGAARDVLDTRAINALGAASARGEAQPGV